MCAAAQGFKAVGPGTCEAIRNACAYNVCAEIGKEGFPHLIGGGTSCASLGGSELDAAGLASGDAHEWSGLTDRLPNAEEAFCEARQFLKGNLAGGIGDRLVRLWVSLEEDAVGTGGEGGAGEGGDVFALTAAHASGSTGELHAMACVDDSGVLICTHDAKTTHVDHKVLIPKGAAAFGLPDFGGIRCFKFFHYKLHFLRREELTLLDVDSARGFSGGEKQVGLTAEEGGDLEDIDDRTDRFALLGQVDVCNGFEAVFFLNRLKDFEPRVDSDTAVAMQGGPVGFVEGPFKEDIEFGVFLLQALQAIGYRATGIEAFKRAGTRYKEQLVGIMNHRIMASA